MNKNQKYDDNQLVDYTRKPSLLSVRLSTEEREKLETSAHKADLSLSRYVRHILVGEAGELDDLIATRGRQRPLPNWETIAELARARIALGQIADGLINAEAIGSKVTLRALVGQLENIQQTLDEIRKSRR